MIPSFSYGQERVYCSVWSQQAEIGPISSKYRVAALQRAFKLPELCGDVTVTTQTRLLWRGRAGTGIPLEDSSGSLQL